MKILVAGDLVIGQPYDAGSKLDKTIIDLFANTDLSIVNLEAPITDSTVTIKKTGPNLKMHRKSIDDVLDRLCVNVVTLANNHILDYSEQGVLDTLASCERHRIKTVGAGKNLEEASKTLFVESKEGRIAIVNFAENEWSSATVECAGSNPMDLVANTAQIQEAKQNSDFVILIIHGGNEHYNLPSPRMQNQYRFYAECGADLVIGHHPHCFSGYEIHKNTPIFYSLGNFLFPIQKLNRGTWYDGLLLKLDIKTNKKIQFEVIPVRQNKKDFKLSLLSHKIKTSIFEEINRLNNVIADKHALKSEWQRFVEQNMKKYISLLSPIGGIKNPYIRGGLYRLGVHRWFMNREYIKETLNRIRCEAHLDVTKAVFERLLKKEK